MAKIKPLVYYSPLEEKINVNLHIFGIFLSVIALILLILRGISYQNTTLLMSFIIFGISLITLYVASTLYHNAKDDEKRLRLRIFDHASIYVLIAGTYTPITLVTLNGDIGWTLFFITWGMAFFGILLKFFYTGRFRILSTAIYIFMGWIIVFALDSLIANYSKEGIQWMVAGGLSYTFGAILYSIKAIPMNHAMFHVLILVGSACHFIAIYNHVHP